MEIDPKQFYRPQHPVLREVAAIQTLAKWRHLGVGPAWTRSGSRVLYSGADVLDWLNANRIDPSRGSE